MAKDKETDAQKLKAKVSKRDGDPPAVYNEPIPTIFVDGFQGVSSVSGVVRINLFEEKFNINEDQVNRHIVARLAMSEKAFVSFAEVMNNIKDSMGNLNIEEEIKNAESE